MKNTFLYKTFFYNKAGAGINPFYILHYSKNIKQATENAKSYYIGYISNSTISSMEKNFLNKNFVVKTIRLKKL